MSHRFTARQPSWRTVVLLSAVLSALYACGSGTEAEPESGTTGTTTTGGTTTGGPTTAPAPSRESFPNFSAAVGFYDKTREHTDRAIRNDLSGGALAGMVQFVQSHSVNPAGNAANNLPTLVSSRKALLLFTPQTAATSLSVEVSAPGIATTTLAMDGPEFIPTTDVLGTLGRPSVAYSKRAWSVELPWTAVKPGMALAFRDDAARSGRLEASKIEMGAPAKMIIWGVRLGMLTEPPVSTDHHMLLEPESAAVDYFQTLPVSQLVVAAYEDVTLDRVMLDNGTVLTGASTVVGGVYDGDMREQVGKATYSIGINYANYGVPSTQLGSQGIERTTPQIVYHHSAGMYANGRQEHGLSGGGAIATIYGSHGNEFSHEVGHHFGLGHYPGQVTENGVVNAFWAAHHADSGWGYIGHRKRMRSNLTFGSDNRAGNPVDGNPNPEHYESLYSYGADAMSGGGPVPERLLSRYTHYTGYTAKRTQDFVSRAWFDPMSSTGYSQWDAATGRAVSVVPQDRRDSRNIKDRLAPSRFGIPVFTLLGGYDPSNAVAAMYPPARTNYGMVFDRLPAPDAAAAAACWLNVQFESLAAKSIALDADRISTHSANKYHVNIAQSDKPTLAAVHCRRNGTTTKLAEVNFPRNLPAMAAAVVVGEAAGYDALAIKELPQLDTLLSAMASDAQPYPSRPQRLLLDSWSDRRSQLSAAAIGVLDRIDTTRDKALALDRWMSANAAGLDARTSASFSALQAQLTSSGLLSGASYADAYGQVLGSGDGCLALSTDDANTARLVMVGRTSCARVPAQLWLLDKRGALRNAAFPGHCLTMDSNAPTLVECNREAGTQLFEYSANVLLPTARSGMALDLNQGSGQVEAYGRHDGANQTWRNLKPDASTVLTYLSPANARRLLAMQVPK